MDLTRPLEDLNDPSRTPPRTLGTRLPSAGGYRNPRSRNTFKIEAVVIIELVVVVVLVSVVIVVAIIVAVPVTAVVLRRVVVVATFIAYLR